MKALEMGSDVFIMGFEELQLSGRIIPVDQHRMAAVSRDSFWNYAEKDVSFSWFQLEGWFSVCWEEMAVLEFVMVTVHIKCPTRTLTFFRIFQPCSH